MTLTFYERGVIQGQLKSAVLLLEDRFSPLPPAVKKRVEAMSADQLRELLLALLRAQTLKDLGLEE